MEMSKIEGLYKIISSFGESLSEVGSNIITHFIVPLTEVGNAVGKLKDNVSSSMLKSSSVTNQATRDMSKDFNQLENDINLLSKTGNIDLLKNINSDIESIIDPLKQVSTSLVTLYDKSNFVVKKINDSSKIFKKFGNTINKTFTNIGDSKAFKKIKDSFDSMIIKSKDAMDGIKSKLNPLFQKMSDNFYKSIDGIKSRLNPLFAKIPDNLYKTMDGIKSKLNPLFAKISDNIYKTMDGIKSKLNPLFQKISNNFHKISGGIFSGLKSILGVGLKMIAPAAIIGILLLGLGVAQQKMGTQLNQLIGMITKKGPLLIHKFTGGLISQIPNLINTGTTLLMKLIKALTANIPSLISAAAAIITSLVNGVAKNAPRLIPVVLSLIQTILISIINNLPKIIMAGLNLLMALVQGISQNTNKIVNTITQVIIRMITVISQNVPVIISTGIKILTALITGIVKAIPQLIAALPQIYKAIVNSLRSMSWKDIGINIIKGIGAGIAAVAPELAKNVINAAKSALKGVKNFLGIHSPSTKFKEEIGAFIPAGIAAGIDDNGDMVNSSLNELSKNLKFNTDLKTTLNANTNLGAIKGTSYLSNDLINLKKSIVSSENNEGSDLLETLKSILELIKIIANSPAKFDVNGKTLWESLSPYAALAAAGRR